MSDKHFTRADITQDFLRQLFDYDASTGRLIWRSSSRGHKAGEVAGTVQKGRGYRQVCISSGASEVVTLEHRLVFLFHHGYLPKQIDHINLDKGDNRIENLRPADASTNQMNIGPRCNSKTGIKGVTWDASRCKWKATIKVNGKRYFLGRFPSLDEAHEARKAAQHLHGAYSRL